jgi:hypothetical protein
MSITDDLDPDALISRLAGPLSPPDRAAFRAAAEDALTRVPCWGEGSLYRASRPGFTFGIRVSWSVADCAWFLL